MAAGRRCSPKLEESGYQNRDFAYVPSHLTYMLLELFKNAARASIEKHHARSDPQVGDEIPPIQVSVFNGDQDITIKISDEGGGIHKTRKARVFEYAFTTIRNHRIWSKDSGSCPFKCMEVTPRRSSSLSSSRRRCCRIGSRAFRQEEQLLMNWSSWPLRR